MNSIGATIWSKEHHLWEHYVVYFVSTVSDQPVICRKYSPKCPHAPYELLWMDIIMK